MFKKNYLSGCVGSSLKHIESSLPYGAGGELSMWCMDSLAVACGLSY